MVQPPTTLENKLQFGSLSESHASFRNNAIVIYIVIQFVCKGMKKVTVKQSTLYVERRLGHIKYVGKNLENYRLQ